jgi:hypothetical protein
VGLFLGGPSRARLSAWRAAAEACGVGALSPRMGGSSQTGWTGRRRSLTVTLSSSSGWPHRGTHVMVEGVASGFALIPTDGPRTARKRVRTVKDPMLGDPVFDKHFVVEGRLALAQAVLSGSTRQRVWAMLNGRLPLPGSPTPWLVGAAGEMHGGRLGVVLPEGPLTVPHPWLPSAFCTILDAAEHLVAPPDIPRALANNARSDPLWLVRLNTVRTLVREYPGHPATLDALHAAAQDPSEEVRLRAGIELGEKGAPVLLQLAENATFDDFGAQAVAALGPRLPRERARAILAAAPGRGRPTTAVACIDSLGGHGSAEDAALLVEALSSDVPDVRLSAAAALGALGSAEAVLPLQEAARRFGGLMPTAARHAITAIQARLAGATRGQVSLDGGPAGDLSLVDDRAGALSIRPKP